MAGGAGPRAEYLQNVQDQVQEVVDDDDFDSAEGFDNPRAAIEEYYSRQLLEMERSPEALGTIFDMMDADGQIIQRMLCQERWYNRAWAGLRDWRTPANIGRVNLPQIPIGKLALSAVGGTAMRGILTATGLGAIASEAAGAASGILWGRKRGKDQTESAATWMSELDMLELSEDEMAGTNADGEYLVSNARLEAFVGIVKNAVENNRFRGESPLLLELASKYRLAKCLLHERYQQRNENQPMSPIEQRIDNLIQADGELEERQMRRISKEAGAQYAETYRTMAHEKSRAVFRTALRGALVGTAVGGLAHFLNAQGGVGGAIHWIRDHLHGLSHSNEEHINAAMDSALEAKKAALEAHSGPLHYEQGVHLDNQHAVEGMDTAYKLGALDTNDLAAADQAALHHFQNIEGLSSSGHDAFVGGLHTGELGHFSDLLGGDHQALQEFATNHNIDLGTVMPNGEHFGEFLIDHHDTFATFPPDIQNFVLSHPSIASELFDVAANRSEIAVQALFDKFSIVLGMAGIGLAGLAYGLLGRGKRANIQAARAALDAGYENNRMAEAGHERTQDAAQQERIRGNRENSRSTLEGATVRFIGRGNRNTRYQIRSIGADNTLDLVMTDGGVVPANMRTLSMNDFLTEQGTIDRNLIDIIDDDPLRYREQSLQELEDASWVSFPADPQPNRRYRIQSIDPNGAMVLDPQGNFQPPLDRNVNQYLLPNGQINRPQLRVGPPSEGNRPEQNPNAALEQYERFVNQNFTGSLEVDPTSGERVFRVATAPRGLPNPLRIRNNNLPNWPEGIPLQFFAGGVQMENNQPVFTGDVRLNLAGVQGIAGSYRYGNRFDAMAAGGGGRANQKELFLNNVQQLDPANYPNAIIQDRMSRQLYVFSGMAGNDYNFTQIDMSTTPPSIGGQITRNRNALLAMPMITFERA